MTDRLTVPRIDSAPAEDPRRHIPIAGMFNLRDVGGYPTRSGGLTRWRTLLRGDSPHRLTDPCRAVFAEMGLGKVIDLRSDDELHASPGAWGGLRVAKVHRPIYNADEADPAQWANDLRGVYRGIVTNRAVQLSAAVADVARGDHTPTLVHCAAGKDRTGLVIALALTLAGVSEDDVLADYALTSRYLHAGADAAVAQLYGASAAQTVDGRLLACPPEVLADTLRRIRTSHGGVEEYVLRNGTTRAELARLQRVLVAPGA
jgi:protein-tyrosine phosphatase